VNATDSNLAGQVTVEYVDIYQDRRKTEKYGVEQPGLVLLMCGDKRRALTWTTSTRSRTGSARPSSGEQAVTAAILDVSNPERKKIYFLVGHGELRPDDVDPCAASRMVRDQLRLRNYDVDTLELASNRKVPRRRRAPRERGPDRRRSRPSSRSCCASTWAPAGRLILFLAPNTQPGLGTC
jgi:hypothetical protein